MALDLTKPVIHKRTGDVGRVVGKLDRPNQPIVVAFRYKSYKGKPESAQPGVAGPAGEEYIMCYGEDELANPPESRWLNVYAGKKTKVTPDWHESRESADSSCAYWGSGRIAVIEDKQDGSEWIIHKVSN